MEFLFYLFLAYCAGSAAEWFSHTILMHKRTSGFVGVYTLHMEHHRAYPRNYFQWSVDEGTYKGLVLCLEHIMVFMLPLALIALPFKPLLSLALVAFGVVHFFLYNAIHPAEHLMHRPWFLPTKVFEALCFYHYIHHQQPSKNMNVVLIGFDYIMGTAGKPTYNDLKEWVGVRNVIRSNYPASKVDRENLKKLDNCLLSPKSLRYMQNGYIAPAPGFEASLVGSYILKLVLKLFVGSCLAVKGKIPDLSEGPYVFACSHNSWADLFAFKSVVFNVRVAAAQSVMKYAGLGFILGPFLGCFSVAPGNGIAVKAGTDLLKRGESLLICPEGWAYQSKETKPFQSGVTRMAKGGNAQIVPVYIDYGVYRSKVFLSLPFPLQVILDAIDPFKHRGYNVIIGEPLPPDTPLEVVEFKVKKLGGYYGF